MAGNKFWRRPSPGLTSRLEKEVGHYNRHSSGVGRRQAKVCALEFLWCGTEAPGRFCLIGNMPKRAGLTSPSIPHSGLDRRVAEVDLRSHSRVEVV